MEKTILDLGFQPLVNNLHKTKNEAINSKGYPLSASINSNLLIKLNHEVLAEKLYTNYLYKSSINKPYIDHCKVIWNSIKYRNPKIILDIGGNDGSLLKTFQKCSKEKLKLINVDASLSFKDENESANIEYINAFFNKDLDIPKADVITSTNVFQHTKNISKFLEGIKSHLGGIWILEFPYTLRTFQTLQFDQFYHEHYYYWLLTPLVRIFSDYGLEVVEAEEDPIHGGTLRLFITHKSPSNKIRFKENFLKIEQNFDFQKASKDIEEKIIRDKEWLKSIEGRIAFFGAAAKGCVYLNALKINASNFPKSYIIDDTLKKQNLYMPGTGFQICPRERLLREQPENLIILAHNFKKHIINSLRPEFKGNIITMLPKIEIDKLI